MKAMYIFLDDDQKIDMASGVVSDLVETDTMTDCSKCGHSYVSVRNGCPECGNLFGIKRPMTAVEWIDTNDMGICHYESVWGQQTLLELPFDAYINTYFDTITVDLKRSFETWSLPPKQEWVFDLDQYLENHRIQRKRRKSRNRKSAVTAA